MSYFIFLKNLDNIEGTIYKIAEENEILNNLNIIQSDYKIIEDSIDNFNLVKFGKKFPIKYNDNKINYIDQTVIYNNKEDLKNHITIFSKHIKQFTDNNPNHSLFNLWDNYYIQLNNLNLDSIVYPLNKSLEQYFNDLEQPSYNILQLP
jgi:hypothetical protein